MQLRFSISALFFLALTFANPVLAEIGPAPGLPALFRGDKLWSGGDGAYSVGLGTDKALWFFGDSFIGTIAGGKRIDNEMVHNAVCVQDLKKGTMQFYWAKKTSGKSGSFFPESSGHYLWPGDAVSTNDKLFCFEKRVITLPGKAEDPFGFVWQQDELVLVDNPNDEPDRWQSRHLALPFTTKDLHLGTACIRNDGKIYVMGLREKSKEAILARITEKDLAELNLSGFEFLKQTKSGTQTWARQIKSATALWNKAAAESTISRIPGGFLCVYHRNGMGAEIVGRTAKKIDGPWSGEKLLYTVPKDECKRGFCYAAKAHPEQASAPGEILITYSINPGDMAAHAKDPDAYFPHVVYVKLPPVD